MKMTGINAINDLWKSKHKPPATIQGPGRKLPKFKLFYCILLCALGIWLLLENESSTASQARFLNETWNNITVIEDPQNIPEIYENHLVYVSGPLWIAKPLTEPEYGVSIYSVKLKREVQEYSHKPINGDLDTYSEVYFEWRNKLTDLNKFYIRIGYENPKLVAIKDEVFIADKVKIGAVTLGLELKEKFNDFMLITSNQRPSAEINDLLKVHDGIFYPSRQNLANPQLGDIRIPFYYAGKAGDIYSVIGKLKNGTIVPYVSSDGHHTFLLLYKDKFTTSFDRIFHKEDAENIEIGWFFRVIGLAAVFFSTACLLNIILKTFHHPQNMTYVGWIINISDFCYLPLFFLTIGLIIFGILTLLSIDNHL